MNNCVNVSDAYWYLLGIDPAALAYLFHTKYRIDIARAYVRSSAFKRGLHRERHAKSVYADLCGFSAEVVNAVKEGIMKREPTDYGDCWSARFQLNKILSQKDKATYFFVISRYYDERLGSVESAFKRMAFVLEK